MRIGQAHLFERVLILTRVEDIMQTCDSFRHRWLASARCDFHMACCREGKMRTSIAFKSGNYDPRPKAGSKVVYTELESSVSKHAPVDIFHNSQNTEFQQLQAAHIQVLRPLVRQRRSWHRPTTRPQRRLRPKSSLQISLLIRIQKLMKSPRLPSSLLEAIRVFLCQT